MTRIIDKFALGQPALLPGGELALPGISQVAPAGIDVFTVSGPSVAPSLTSSEPASPNQAPRFSNQSKKLFKNLETISALMSLAGDGRVFEYGFSYRDNRVGVEISDPRIIPPRELPPPQEQFQVDCRASIPMPSRSADRVTTLEANFRIGDKNLMLRAEESPDDFAILSLHDPEENLELSSVKFRSYGGKLHLYSFYTNARKVRNSYSTSLQRLAYLVAGEPNVVVIHELMHTNPCYQDVADAYLDAGDVNDVPFFPKKLALALQRIFDRRVHSFNLLNKREIEKDGLRLNKNFELSVAPTTTFDVEIKLYGIRA